MKYTAEQIENRFKMLPEDLQKILSSVGTTDILLDIGDSFNLHVDKIGELVDETTLLILGFTKSADFVNNLRDRLEVSTDLAEKIAKDINDKLLFKIRESLKGVQGAEERAFVEDASVQKNTEDVSASDREKILEEIENPVVSNTSNKPEPVSQPIQTPETVEVPETPKTPEVQEEKQVLPPQTEPTTTQENKVSEEKKENFEEKGLKQEMGSIKSIEPVLVDEKTKQSYQVDPYREPIE